MRRVNQCLNPRLTEIIHHALQVKSLDIKLSEYLPAHLREHVTVGSFNQGCLVLTTLDPMWASQLRYLLPELRDALRKNAGLYQLASIKINVCADALPPKTTSQPKLPPLSAVACQTIIESSELCEYEPLKQALKNLAMHRNE